jgi:hypothetical protein
MIQRIQSLFLLAVIVTSFLVVFNPILYISLSDDTQANLTSIGLRTITKPPLMLRSAYPIAILAVASGLMSLVTLILYQRRLLQMRLCGYNIILNFLLIVVIFIYYYSMRHMKLEKDLFIVSRSFSYTVLLPFINIILLFQAFRAVRRDDMLIKSYDRLR